MPNRSTNYRIAGAKQNRNRTGTLSPKNKNSLPGSEYKFSGTENTPINKNANEKSVLNHLNLALRYLAPVEKERGDL